MPNTHTSLCNTYSTHPIFSAAILPYSERLVPPLHTESSSSVRKPWQPSSNIFVQQHQTRDDSRCVSHPSHVSLWRGLFPRRECRIPSPHVHNPDIDHDDVHPLSSGETLQLPLPVPNQSELQSLSSSDQVNRLDKDNQIRRWTYTAILIGRL